MPYIQLASPNLTVKGKSGYCLSIAEDVGGASHLYRSASEAWDKAESKHPNELPPPNVCVPIFWSFTDINETRQDPYLKKPDHVAWWIPGKGILSSPFDKSYGNQWFRSIQAVTDRINEIKGASSKYLGWSEVISNVRVVKEGDEMFTPEEINILVQLAGNFPATDDQKAVYSTKPINEVLMDILNSDWNVRLRTNAQAIADGKSVVNKQSVVNYIITNLK